MNFQNQRKWKHSKENEKKKKKNANQRELEKIENAIIDEIFVILQQIIELVTDFNKDTNDDITFVKPNNEIKIRSTREMDSTTNQSSNISMNINRDNDPIHLQGGSQLHPSMNNHYNRLSQRARAQAEAQARNYPNVRNTYQPQRGPGGRAEAPRDQVVMGSQALQYASNIANRIRQRSSQNNSENVRANVNVPGRMMTYGSGNILGGSTQPRSTQPITTMNPVSLGSARSASVSREVAAAAAPSGSSNSNVAATAA